MIHPTDLPTLHAAASALRHAPPHMRAQHLAERLEEMARRVREATATIQESLHVGGDDADTSTDT